MPERTQFTMPMRILHWLVAAMVLTMLYVGVSMVASIAHYHALLSIHRPLGIAVLVVALVRLITRLNSPLPPFPPTVRPREQRIASASEYLMYTLMFAMPLIGWGILSAARYPVTMFASLRLPYILPHSAMLYWWLRKAAHGAGVSVFPDVFGPFQRSPVPHADCARWIAAPDGSMDGAAGRAAVRADSVA